MTPFSSALEFYMKEKDIKTYAIAQYCGIDRSNMYKIINGKRNPASEEIVERIAEYLRLKPLERNHLVDVYQITVMGYDTYHRRKSVQDFLASFSENHIGAGEDVTRKGYMTMKVDEEELRHCQGMVVTDRRLRNLILSVLNTEIQKPEGKICMVMQPENVQVMDMLVSAGTKKKELIIEHIFCLSNTNDIVYNNKDYNLWCLNNILPMFAGCICDYRPYCYYDNIVSHNNKFNLLSSMILTSDYAVVFSMEENYGMLLSDGEAVRYLQTQFQLLREDTSLMACKMDTLEKQLECFEQLNFLDGGVSFQPEACMLPMLPASFPEKYLNRNILSQPQLKERVLQYLSYAGKIPETSKALFLCTENGMRRFADQGRVSELPESIYYPLEYHDRALLIRRLMKECEKGNFRMVRADAPIAESELCLYSGMQDGYLLFPNMQGEKLFIELRESGLLNSFRDYLEHLDEKYLYRADEAIEVLKNLLKRKPLSYL